MADKTLKEMVLDLTEVEDRRFKVSQKEIGLAIGVKQSTVSDFIHRHKNARVHYETYEALKKFHASQMRRRQQARAA